jgi:aspartate racemase
MGERKNFTIGVLGGMGTYATINMFRQYADIFEAEKEWDRPRIIIDNRCTMPSRVRAIMYNENIELLVDEMIDSLQSLVTMGAKI